MLPSPIYRATANYSPPSHKKSVAGPEERGPKYGEDGYVKRPENAFILFRRKYCKLSVTSVKADTDVDEGGRAGGNGETKRQRQAALAKAISEQWKALSPEERAKWEELAREKRRQHEALHPGYMYRPVRRGWKNSAVPSATSPSSSVPASTAPVASTPPLRKRTDLHLQTDFGFAAPRPQHGWGLSALAQLIDSFSHIDWEALGSESGERTNNLDGISTATNLDEVELAEMDLVLDEKDDSASWQPEGHYVDSLLASWERRLSLLSMTVLSEADRDGRSTQVRERLGAVEVRIGMLVIQILDSRDARHAAQLLATDRAQSFVDAIQNVLDRGTLPDSSSRSKARKLMQKISEAVEQLPSCLFITGVNDRDEHPTFGGGFSDVYQASYQGKTVALKRLRIFTADSTPHRTRSQFYKEALVWHSLRHPFVLPLLGIDRSTFTPSFCMVSPWMNFMKHGTILKYLRDHGCAAVTRLLLEIAQGLDYLHSMDVVHGDLRGINILISDDGNACLSDSVRLRTRNEY
ncbi:hypothetical protein C8R45DRAFT_267767 [Mycena sanguinolenta]|nr:hypothetical protein C8R45DRAFT_267767 [Mycena sanguinolenta]